jgi:hypothetical protein
MSGEFYLEKSTFARGEPIFLYFQVVNDGPKGENLHSADPYSLCSGYQISVSTDPSITSSCALAGVGGSCASSYALLPPGKKRIERVLLNIDHKVDAPGDYSVEALRNLPHASVDANYFTDATKGTLQTHTTLYFRVDQNATQDARAFQPWLDQLHSVDPVKRHEAALTLASVAPRYLEDTLLAFADIPEFRPFAPLAFHRLNTPRSLAAMAQLLRKTEAGAPEHMQSADYLAESDDLQWFPLLREVGQKNARISSYLADAAELGGDKMLPTLVALLGSPDTKFTRLNAVMAMGWTGSRAAVPILLELLRNPDEDIADRARYGLRLLTHRMTSNDQGEAAQSEYPKWSQWWAHEGGNAPIYKAKECGDFTPLP